MKKILLVLVILLSFGLSKAQTSVYHPFPTDNAIWSNRIAICEYPYPPVWYPPLYYCMGSADTTIGTHSYSIIDSCGGPYFGALRDDGAGKVYFVPADSTIELLIYDFTVPAGDTVSVYSLVFGNLPFQKWTYHTGAIDSVMIAGSYRKRMSVEGYHWIEGIGSDHGLFSESWINVSNECEELRCVSVNDSVLYPSFSIGACSFADEIVKQSVSDKIVIFPNPTNGIFKIEFKNLEKSIKIIDVLGKIILEKEIKNESIEIDLSDFENGIYVAEIVDGKGNSVVKKVVKE